MAWITLTIAGGKEKITLNTDSISRLSSDHRGGTAIISNDGELTPVAEPMADIVKRLNAGGEKIV